MPWDVQELKLLDDEANVFKAVGPVLVKQDLMEARTNVTNRLEFIKKDMERLDNQIKGVESKMMDREREVSLRVFRYRRGGVKMGAATRGVRVVRVVTHMPVLSCLARALVLPVCFTEGCLCMSNKQYPPFAALCRL